MKMQEFSDGIAKRGLLHAIILRESSGLFTLVAGERRLRAITDLADLGQQIIHDGQKVPLGHIPYTLMEDLDPLAYEEAELEENVHRENLTWQERAAAVARLSRLRLAQAQAEGSAPPSVADLSLEVRGSSEGKAHETTRQELIVSRHLSDPEIAGAKSVGEAFKALKKKELATKHRELGLAVGKTFSASLHSCKNEDSLVWMCNAPSATFDVLLTDPPYGMGADEFGDSGGLAAGFHGYRDDEETALRCYSVLAKESFRLCKEQAHAYVFCDSDRFLQIRELFSAAGWRCFRTPLIWYKKQGMRAPWPLEGPQRKYEMILYAIKGNRPTLCMEGDVLDIPSESNLGHAAQKPVALYSELLRRSVLPGQFVFDPFCGTGPIFLAAHALKARATGIEIDTAFYGIAIKRIGELQVQSELDISMGL